MIPDAELNIKPFIMIVEDSEEGRDNYSEMLRINNCSVITASSANEALKSYMTSPKLDLIFTDIDLKGHRARDKSGVDIAKFIKHLDSELPVVGYSSKFEDDELSTEEKSYFNSWFDKGNMDVIQMKEMCLQLKELANAHKRARFIEIVDIFNKLKSKNVIDQKEFGEVLELAVTYDSTPFGQLEDGLSENGYSLKLVTPKTSNMVDKPFLVWIKKEENIVEVEVYGYPDIYSYGVTEDNAIVSLLNLMNSFASDMKNDKAENYAGPALMLRKFLLYIIK